MTQKALVCVFIYEHTVSSQKWNQAFSHQPERQHHGFYKLSFVTGSINLTVLPGAPVVPSAPVVPWGPGGPFSSGITSRICEMSVRLHRHTPVTWERGLYLKIDYICNISWNMEWKTVHLVIARQTLTRCILLRFESSIIFYPEFQNESSCQVFFIHHSIIYNNWNHKDNIWAS